MATTSTARTNIRHEEARPSEAPSGTARSRARSSAGEEPGDPTLEGVNLAVVWGWCSAGVEQRTLESGGTVAAFAVRTGAGARPRRPRSAVHGRPSATSVPVTMWDPPAWLGAVEPGDPLVVVGTVRRRFFATRSGGRGTRAEVEAVTVARATPAQRERALRRAIDALGALV